MSIPKIILVCGPMSTGTRIFTRLLSEHPDICGLTEGDDHYDLLDNMWEEIRQAKYGAAMTELKQTLKDKQDYKYIITRRSSPHGTKVGSSGESYYPDFDTFFNIALAQTGIVVFVTSRNPYAALESATLKRAATEGDKEIAWEMYQEALEDIFVSFPRPSDLDFYGAYIVSLEGLFYEKYNYLNGMLNLLSLSPMEETKTPIEDELNAPYYIKLNQG